MVTFLVSATFDEGMSATQALRAAFPNRRSPDKVIINLGSGLQELGGGIINVDVEPFESVRVVADAADLPFRDASADMIISISLLEHCPEPERVIAEMTRVVKPGGYVYCAIPFLYPFHGSPDDYTRFTLRGLTYRLRDFEPISAGTNAGPITALLIQVAYILALITSFGSVRLYDIVLQFWIVLFSPLRVLNVILRPFARRQDAAAAIYFFGRKR